MNDSLAYALATDGVRRHRRERAAALLSVGLLSFGGFAVATTNTAMPHPVRLTHLDDRQWCC